jgi:hypothetical protein
MEIALKGAVKIHKDTAFRYINSSDKSVSFKIVRTDITPSTGSSMFGDLQQPASEEDRYEITDPIKCIWTDANSTRATENSREAGLVRRYVEASVVAKVLLEDVLIDPEKPYGETLIDRAIGLIMDGFEFEIMGYDRYGLGTTDPYILAMALRGLYTNER